MRRRPVIVCQTQFFDVSIGRTQMDMLAFLMVALSTSLVIIDSLCKCLFASLRVLLNLASVGFNLNAGTSTLKCEGRSVTMTTE